MKEWIVNIFLYVKTSGEESIIGRIGSVWHERGGTDAEKIAYLQSQVSVDSRDARPVRLPERMLLVCADGKNLKGLITYSSFQLLPPKFQMELFEETVFRNFSKCPQNPVMVVTPIVDGKPRIEGTVDVTPF